MMCSAFGDRLGMPRAIGRLSALSVSRLKSPGRYADGGGLHLLVYRSGARSWYFRYMLHGKPREMGLGSLNDVPLAEARKRAAAARQLKSGGTDPIEARRSERQEAELEAARALTFRQCAEAYVRAHRPGWKSAKHAAQWPSTLETYAYPVFGNLVTHVTSQPEQRAYRQFFAYHLRHSVRPVHGTDCGSSRQRLGIMGILTAPSRADSTHAVVAVSVI